MRVWYGVGSLLCSSGPTRCMRIHRSPLVQDGPAEVRDAEGHWQDMTLKKEAERYGISKCPVYRYDEGTYHVL